MALAARRSLSRLTHLDFALLSIYWIAIGYLWTSLGGLILPDLVVHLVGNAHKGPALGVLEGVGSLMAVVWQPLVGSYSDRTRTRFGRRHPFIFAGTVGDVIFLVGIALSGSYSRRPPIQRRVRIKAFFQMSSRRRSAAPPPVTTAPRTRSG